jgi:hypothetical protein
MAIPDVTELQRRTSPTPIALGIYVLPTGVINGGPDSQRRHTILITGKARLYFKADFTIAVA